MLESLKDLQNLMNEQIENIAKFDTEKERRFFFAEYKRIKAELDRRLDEYAEGLANFDIL